ncbi:MAG: hypothetical protein QOH39_2663 [Verrucomicrobiota bacterium]|jgi:4-amino-4-deoxy-L-arabinose transferase-like glycosyltransferase
MTERFSFQSLLQSTRTVWVVGVFAFILFLATDLPWQLDDYDQAKQAFTSFEIVKEGHWFYQRTPHEHVATKPPLVAWISAGLFTITRSWDAAWRVPSLLSAVAISLLLFRHASSSYGTAAGLIAFSAFNFNLLTPRLATLVRTDMALTLAIFLIGLQIWQKIRKREVWRFHDRLLIFVLLTAAMLIKGPIVYAFLLPGIAIFQWWARKNNAPDAWCGWWPWMGSLAIFLFWAIGGCIFVPQFYEQVVLREFVGRFGETVHRPQPIYFYLPHLLHKFAPWSVLLIGVGIVDLRARQWKIREVLRNISPEVLWLICWSMGALLVMSLIPSKRVDRIFPVIPPLCLLLAAQVAQHRVRTMRWAGVALLVSIFFTAGYAGFKIFTGYRDHRDALVNFGQAVQQTTAANHWRYEILNAPDEGLLLYAQKLHFTRPEQAVAEWNRGNLDALLVLGREAPTMMRDLENAVLSPGPSMPGGEYVLIRR